MKLRINTKTPNVLRLQIETPERLALVELLRNCEEELLVPSDLGTAAFIRRSGQPSADVSNLAAVRLSLPDDIVEHLIDSLEKQVLEHRWPPMQISLGELDAEITPHSIKDVTLEANNYIEVDSQEEMKSFLCVVDGFHDCLLREVVLISRGFVDEGGSMHFGGGADCGISCDARLVVQSQFNDINHVEIVFEGVESLSIAQDTELWDGNGEVNKQGVWLSLNHHKVHSRAMKYRLLGREFLGSRPQTALPVILDRTFEGPVIRGAGQPL